MIRPPVQPPPRGRAGVSRCGNKHRPRLLTRCCQECLLAGMTPTQQLLDVKLGGTLAERVATSRAAGVAWNKLAAHLTDASGIEVTGESLRQWFGDHA